MTDDPYTVLGVAREATDKQIRAAFLKLAKTSHPDLNPGDRNAEARFKAINAAHNLLSDPKRRAQFDNGEIDAAGTAQPPPGPPPGEPPMGARFYRDHAEGPAGAQYRAAFNGEDAEDLGDILSGLFGAQARARRKRRGEDVHYTLTVPFLDAMRGTTQRLVLPDGGSLDVSIPPGLDGGQILRLRGKGGPGDPPGDALVEVTLAPHPVFRREGRDIHLDLPVTVAEAMLGGRVTVPTLDGAVAMTIPPGSDTGTRLRLRGKGIPGSASKPAGDAYATLRVVLGPEDKGLASFLRGRKDAPAWNPRAKLEDTA